MEKVNIFQITLLRLLGRDGYILYDSGGAVKPTRIHSARLPKSNKTQTKKYNFLALQYHHPVTKHKNPRTLNLIHWPKTFHYNPDGSGRDRYIK